MPTLHFIDAVRETDDGPSTRFRIFFRYHHGVQESWHEPGEDHWAEWYFAVNLSLDTIGNLPEIRPHVVGAEKIWCYAHLHDNWEAFENDDCVVVNADRVAS